MLSKQPHIFMIAGEKSGDLLGSSILHALKRQKEDLIVTGIGGPLMQAQGLISTVSMDNLQVMGFLDVALHLPSLIKTFQTTLHTILQLNPPMVVTIDYPGFNLRLAQALRKKGYLGKLCHIVCPSVWAWGKNRIEKLTAHYNMLLTLLPFEKPLFKNSYLQVEYIGHPLLQNFFYEENLDPSLIAFFPGSRSHEIKRNLPFYLRLIPKLQALNPDLEFVISLSQEKYRPLIQKMAPSTPIPLVSPDQMREKKPQLAVAKCGTVVLELALRGIPTIVTYGMSLIDTLLAKYIFKISLPFYSLPNLILNRPLFPELIGPNLTDDTLLKTILPFLESPEKIRHCRLECQKVRKSLTIQKNSYEHAAALILSQLFR